MARARREDGFSLVEVLAAIFVFAVVTLGVVPLLASSLRGTNLARSQNVAKNLAVEAMERARGLPYYVSYDSQPVLGGGRTDVDLLDFYHPAPPNSGEYYETICNAGSTAPACPRSIPSGYRVVYRARFVRPDGTTTAPTPASYNTDGVADEPPSLLVDFVVQVRTTAVLNRARTYTLTTLIGSRKFGRLLRGSASVQHALQVRTTFDSGAGSPRRTSLVGLAGVVDAEVEQRSTVVATQAVDAATFTLVDADDPTLTTIASVEGASDALSAPGDTTKPDSNALAGTLSASGVGNVAGIDQTVAGEPSPAGDLEVGVDSDLPHAKGGTSFTSGADVLDLWVDHPGATGTTAGQTLRLLAGQKILQVVFTDSAADADATSESIASVSEIETEDPFFGGIEIDASTQVEQVRLFPTSFVLSRDATFGGAVVVIDNFQAAVSCDAFSRVSAGTGTATVTWSATLRYWTHASGYVSVPLSGTASSDPLVGVKAANPRVFDDPAPDGTDLYLFPTATNPGFMTDWSGVTNAASGARVSDGGSSAQAKVTGALSLTTAPIPSAAEAFPFQLSFGSLSCQAVDFR